MGSMDFDLDLNALNEEISKLRNNNRSEKSELVLKVNKNNMKEKLRLLPNQHKPSMPFYQVAYHYNIKNFGIMCPKENFGEECPICDFREKLRAGAQTDEERKALKPFFPTIRYYAPVLSRTDNTKAKFWEMSKTVYEEVINKLIKFPELIHPIKGHDLLVEYVPPTGGKKWGKIEVETDMKESKLSEDIEDAKTIIKDVKDLMEILKKEMPNTEQIQGYLDEFFKEDEDNDNSEGASEVKTEVKKEVKAEKVVETKKETVDTDESNIDEEIDNLFG